LKRLKGRIAEMEDRLGRLRDRAAKRRQIAKDTMVELDLKEVVAPDFTASIRPGMPALMVIDEAAVPSIYSEPRDRRLPVVLSLKRASTHRSGGPRDDDDYDVCDGDRMTGAMRRCQSHLLIGSATTHILLPLYPDIAFASAAAAADAVMNSLSGRCGNGSNPKSR